MKLYCAVCCKASYKFELVKHHVSYFPEKTIWIHDKCHRQRKKLKQIGLIQYTNAEYKFFYEDLRQLGYPLPLKFKTKRPITVPIKQRGRSYYYGNINDPTYKGYF